MSKLKVDIVCPTGGGNGGVEHVIRAWTENIDKEKFELRVICLGPCEVPFLGDYSKAYYVTQKAERITLKYLTDTYFQVVSLMGEPDICIATILPIMVEAAVIVFEELGSNTKVVSWIHNSFSFYEANTENGDIHSVAKAKYHLALNQTKVQQIKEAREDAKIYLVGNPLDVTKREGYETDLFQLSYIGRLSYVKRIDIILEALYKADNRFMLRIIGAGELKKEITGWIDLLHLNDRVELLDWKDNPFDYCDKSKILVMASESEGLPMTAIEASAHGMTVITTPVDGIIDYVVEGKNGYYFEQNNADALAQILNDLAKGNISLCEEDKCIESVEIYQKKNYFKTIEKALFEISMGEN